MSDKEKEKEAGQAKRIAEEKKELVEGGAKPKEEKKKAPAVPARTLKRATPRERKKIGKKKGKRKCRICGTAHGIIHKYGLDICRRCFRERAESMGFKKY